MSHVAALLVLIDCRLFRGYHYRIYPHISSTAEKYVHEKTGGHVPCGFYFKGASKAMYGKKRINQEGNGCFELGLGGCMQVVTTQRGIECKGIPGFVHNDYAKCFVILTVCQFSVPVLC